jgi:hypothetical protein
MLIARSPRPRRPRPLTEDQLRRRLQTAQDEIATLAAGHQLSAGQIRYRLLLLEQRIQEMLVRWPEDLSGSRPIRYRRTEAYRHTRSDHASGL